MRVLVTGGSGVAGKAVVAALRARGLDVVLLDRRAGLDGNLRASVEAIIHCAGRSDFSIAADEADEANVALTGRILDFAASCRHLDRIVLLSTVYVAGRRTGVIREDELEHDAGFVNEYERSKYAMELLATRRRASLPIAICRLSTILGDSSGRIERFAAAHRALSLYYHGLVPMIPGVPEAPVDLITSDFAAERIAERLVDFRPVTTHVCAGPFAPSLERFLARTEELFAEIDPRWKARAVERPPIVSEATFARFERSVTETGDAILGQIVASVRDFLPQLARPKTFDTETPYEGFEGDYPRILRSVVRSRAAG
ncbi:MAG: SDR family oxidoreductase [Thermoanaerobaculia bacterium]